ncbi:hypothetical protein AVDCRST_MAG84-2739 [uncultured Microcoleus sp.]|uniref:Uncharacterized protein n=1 Tax=uncultured Microcoleus sp. TaxID=259945 RepID=A0A6J4M4U5_9CYAN|nr:hypothetical protein AVDCRST_MAG84-2739 [uncultured Microcoleus sp.]
MRFKKIFSLSRSYHWRSQPAKCKPNLLKCQRVRDRFWILDFRFWIEQGNRGGLDRSRQSSLGRRKRVFLPKYCL